MARKLSVLVFLVVLLAFTLYPGAEVVQYADSLNASAQSVTQTPAETPASEDETIDFGDQQDVSNPPSDTASDPMSDTSDVLEPVSEPTSIPILGGGDVVVRYTDTPVKPTAEPTPTPIPTPEPTPMCEGMSGPAVAELQQKLVTWGFLSQKPDGIYGTATEDAVSALQEYLSMLVSGVEPDASATFEDESAEDGVVEALSGGEAEATPEPSPKPAPAYPATGIVDGKLMQAMSDGFDVYRETIMTGSSGLDTQRVQRRLGSLNYLYKGDDGVFGEKTAEGLSYFQKVNGIPQTGIADEVTQKLLFSDNAVTSDKPYHPYLLKVDISQQRVYAYAWSGDSYSKLVKKFKCSTGMPKTPTPKGTYQDSTGPGRRWHYFKEFGVWAQYAFYIQGNVMFHSVLFEKKGGRPTYGSVHNLGRKASHGCVRLAVKDAKWIWENCGVGTTVVIHK